jgi:cytochrome b subunit of formate dehydrogenase
LVVRNRLVLFFEIIATIIAVASNNIITKKDLLKETKVNTAAKKQHYNPPSSFNFGRRHHQ